MTKALVFLQVAFLALFTFSVIREEQFRKKMLAPKGCGCEETAEAETDQGL